MLVPELISGQTVILDNATFHKSKKIKELIESVGCKLLCLPPYSPDLNSIEIFGATLKRKVRAQMESFEHLFASINEAFIAYMKYMQEN